MSNEDKAIKDLEYDKKTLLFVIVTLVLAVLILGAFPGIYTSFAVSIVMFFCQAYLVYYTKKHSKRVMYLICLALLISHSFHLVLNLVLIVKVVQG